MPPVSDFVRARKPEQREERRAQILTTARALLHRGVSPRTLSLNELARRAGMAKANFYRYFESREAVLLALMGEEWTLWLEELIDHITKEPPGPKALDSLVAHMARTLAVRPLMCDLTAALPSVLEHNLSEEGIRAFKLESMELINDAAAVFATCCPELPASGHAQLLHDTATVVAGLYPFTHPSEAAARALARPELAFFSKDFATELERYLGALAHDLVARQESTPAD